MHTVDQKKLPNQAASSYIDLSDVYQYISLTLRFMVIINWKFVF